MYLSQSLPLYGVTGFARFFHGFFSVLLLHSGYISKLQFFPLLFHYFTRTLHNNGSISEPQFYLASIIFPSPHFFLCFSSRFNPFSKRSTQIFHCFLSHSFPIVLRHIPSFFPLFSYHFSPPLQSPQVQLGRQTRGESMPHVIYFVLRVYTMLSCMLTYTLNSYLSCALRMAQD